MKTPAMLTSVFLALSLAACGSGTAPIPTTFTGTWDDTVKNEFGVVRTHYKLTQTGNQVSGEAFWANKGQLLHVGSVSGEKAADGTGKIVTILSDNAQSGKALLLGSFKGVGFEGTLTVTRADGSLNQVVAIKLVKTAN